MLHLYAGLIRIDGIKQRSATAKFSKEDHEKEPHLPRDYTLHSCN